MPKKYFRGRPSEIFRPGRLKGVNVYADYTRVESNATLPRGEFILPSQSSNTVNVVVGCNIKAFTSRVSANFQGRLPLAVGATVNDDNWLDRRVQLDFSASQQFGRHVRIFIDLLNLANQPYRVYLDTTTARRTDGIASTNAKLPDFPHGLFVTQTDPDGDSGLRAEFYDLKQILNRAGAVCESG